LGEIGSEPSIELACFLAREARDRLVDIGPVCSNCKLRPQAAATHCFSDWCQQCDDSLYASRFTDNVPEPNRHHQHHHQDYFYHHHHHHHHHHHCFDNHRYHTNPNDSNIHIHENSEIEWSGSSDSDSDLEFESENSDTSGAEISSAYDFIDYDNSSGCAIANRVRWTISNIVFEYVRYFELFIRK
jgi:hypothetical protein